MNVRLIYTFLLLLLLFPALLIAQDITGIWQGVIINDPIKGHPPQPLHYEIVISGSEGQLTGFSYVSITTKGKETVDVTKLKIKQDGDQVIIEDDKHIFNDFERAPPKQIKKTLDLTYSKKDTVAFLKGTWSTNKSKVFLEVTGIVRLERKEDYKSTEAYKKLDSLKLSDALVFTEPQKKTEPIAVKEPPKEEIKITPPPPPAEPKKPEPIIAKVDTVKKMIKPVEQPDAIVKKPEVKQPAAVVQPKPVPPPPVVTKPQPVPPPVAAKAPPKPVAPPPPAPKPVAPPPKPAPIVAAKPPAPEKPKEVVPPPVVKKQETVIVPAAIAKTAAANIVERKTNTLQTVYYKSDSLVLTLYDNGEIDGDTVSVLMNGQVLIARQGLNTKYNAKAIYITEETPDTIKLVMYAENLGSIPPNTGLMVVRDGESVYEVRFSADLKTNAQIILTRRKEDTVN